MTSPRRRKGRQPIITVDEIDALKATGMTQSDIARQYGVTRAYISWIKHNYGGKRTPRELALEHWPWEVADRFTRAVPYRCLRDLAEWHATGGKGMTTAKLDNLRSWLESVEHVVVEYNPDFPPSPGLSSGGYRYDFRTPADGNLLMRLTDEQKTPEVLRYFSRPTTPITVPTTNA